MRQAVNLFVEALTVPVKIVQDQLATAVLQNLVIVLAKILAIAVPANADLKAALLKERLFNIYQVGRKNQMAQSGTEL